MDAAEDLECFAEVQETAAHVGEVGVWRDTLRGTGLGELCLVKVGLETGFKDVEGRCTCCCGHSTYSVKMSQYTEQDVPETTEQNQRVHTLQRLDAPMTLPRATASMLSMWHYFVNLELS